MREGYGGYIYAPRADLIFHSKSILMGIHGKTVKKQCEERSNLYSSKTQVHSCSKAGFHISPFLPCPISPITAQFTSNKEIEK